MSNHVQCGPHRSGITTPHRYIHPVDIAFFADRLSDDDVASIPDKDEVTSSILVSPTTQLGLQSEEIRAYR